jgi:hypothetical protein
MEGQVVGGRRGSQRLLLGTAAACVFGTVLAAWTLNGRTTPERVAEPPRSASSAPTDSSTSSSGPSSSGAGLPRTGANGFPSNFPIGGSNVLNIKTGATHRVTLVATSDSSILRLLYYVRGGNPQEGRYTEVSSPVTISTIGHGGGPIAEIWMQSGIYAHVVSCSITVDGYVRSTDTARGPHNVAICIA